MDIDQLKVALLAEGYRTSPDRIGGAPWIAYRRRDNARRCECNNDKIGIQIVVKPYEFSHEGRKWSSAEVDITGEADGRWYRLSCYSMNPEEIVHQLPEVEAGLLRAWNALTAPTGGGSHG